MPDFVAVQRVVELKRRLEVALQLCDELLAAPDIIVSSPTAIAPDSGPPTAATMVKADPLRVTPVERSGSFDRVGVSVVAPVRPIKVGRKNNYSEIAWRQFGRTEFTLDEYMAFLAPRVKPQPKKFRAIVRAALNRDPRFARLEDADVTTYRRVQPPDQTQMVVDGVA